MTTLLAQAQVIDIAGQQTSITHVGTVGKLIEMGAGAILAVGAIAVLMYLLLGALNWLTAGGDKSKVETAKNEITQAIIGLAILASVFALFGVLLDFFGLRDKIGLSGSGASTSQTSTAGCSDWCAGDNQCLPAGGHRVANMCSYSGCSDPNTYPCKIGN